LHLFQQGGGSRGFGLLLAGAFGGRLADVPYRNPDGKARGMMGAALVRDFIFRRRPSP